MRVGTDATPTSIASLQRRVKERKGVPPRTPRSGVEPETAVPSPTGTPTYLLRARQYLPVLWRYVERVAIYSSCIWRYVNA